MYLQKASTYIYNDYQKLKSIFGFWVIDTAFPSAPRRCAPVAFPVNSFAEITSPVPNYASLAN